MVENAIPRRGSAHNNRIAVSRRLLEFYLEFAQLPIVPPFGRDTFDDPAVVVKIVDVIVQINVAETCPEFHFSSRTGESRKRRERILQRTRGYEESRIQETREIDRLSPDDVEENPDAGRPCKRFRLTARAGRKLTVGKSAVRQ